MFEYIKKFLFKLKIFRKILLSKRLLCVLSNDKVINTFSDGKFNNKDFAVMLIEIITMMLNVMPKERKSTFLEYIKDGGFYKDIINNYKESGDQNG